MLSFIPTPLGNLKDITIRALEHLATSQIILCEDTRVAKNLLKNLFERFECECNFLASLNFDSCKNSPNLQDFPKSKTALDSANPIDFLPTLNPKSKQFIPLHSHNEKDFLSTITPDFFDKEIAYLSDAGMPSICDPGAILVQYMQKHNLPYNVLVGGCALSVAFCFSGFASQSFCFGGFLPHKPKERASKLQKCASAESPTIWYESPHRILETLRDIAEILPTSRVFAIKEISKIYQRHFLGRADEILSRLSKESEKTLQGEWVIILDFEQSKQKSHITLCENDILSLEIPPKAKAKLLSTLTGKDTKEIYANLVKSTKS